MLLPAQTLPAMMYTEQLLVTPWASCLTRVAPLELMGFVMLTSIQSTTPSLPNIAALRLARLVYA